MVQKLLMLAGFCRKFGSWQTLIDFQLIIKTEELLRKILIIAGSHTIRQNFYDHIHSRSDILHPAFTLSILMCFIT